MSGCSSSRSCVSGYRSRNCAQLFLRAGRRLVHVVFPDVTLCRLCAPPGDRGLGAVALQDRVEFARFGGLGRLDDRRRVSSACEQRLRACRPMSRLRLIACLVSATASGRWPRCAARARNASSISRCRRHHAGSRAPSQRLRPRSARSSPVSSSYFARFGSGEPGQQHRDDAAAEPHLGRAEPQSSAAIVRSQASASSIALPRQ